MNVRVLSTDIECIIKRISKILPFFIYEFISSWYIGERKIDRWTNVFTDKQWLEFITSEIQEALRKEVNCIVLIGSGKLSLEIQKFLLNNSTNRNTLRIFVMDIPGQESDSITLLDNKIKKIEKLSEIDMNSEDVAVVACSTSNYAVTKALQATLQHHKLQYSEFIFLIRLSESYPPKKAQYVSSLFDEGLIEEVYKFSLTKCDLKCHQDEAYDLCQLLLQTSEVEGAIAEFGSFRGHSGLIISEFIKRLSIRKKIYLCDAFDKFPTEKYAVDKFWSATHDVDYEKVKKLFGDYNNVHLIRGDFADTIDTIPEDKFSLVYVDCDSYRAVKLVSEKIYPKLISGGAIIYEDYGHPHCLGARYSVDTFYDKKKDCFRFFSGFSGLSIVMKL